MGCSPWCGSNMHNASLLLLYLNYQPLSLALFLCLPMPPLDNSAVCLSGGHSVVLAKMLMLVLLVDVGDSLGNLVWCWSRSLLAGLFTAPP